MGPVILAACGVVLVAISVTMMIRLRPRAYVVHHGAQSQPPLWTAALVPSHRELPGRPSAARTARQVHVITDLPAATGARANREG